MQMVEGIEYISGRPGSIIWVVLCKIKQLILFILIYIFIKHGEK